MHVEVYCHGMRRQLLHMLSRGCRGLLIRGGDILEATSQVDTVVFDKTGTLTQGRPRVQHVLPAMQGLETQQLLTLAAALERESSHPLAAAILQAADSAGTVSQSHVLANLCQDSPVRTSCLQWSPLQCLLNRHVIHLRHCQETCSTPITNAQC